MSPKTDGSVGAICGYLATNYPCALQPAQLPVRVPPRLWTTLQGLTPSGLLDDRPATISRDDLRSLAAHLEDVDSHLRLFCSCIAWGRNSRLYPSDSDLSKALRYPRLRDALMASAALVNAGVPTAAYEAWQACKVPGIGQSFLSKWLFACGLRRLQWNDALQPLVLDRRVWSGLKALGWTSWHANGFTWQPSKAALYGAYLRSLRDWSSVLAVMGYQTSPEHLEILLFDKRGSI